ncbi:TetR/AcrR family transcriptional regulator [Planococcus sp. YIM B11945]|uniref:TetR/AcrR family transcriptional regulator n=1 Tax=Planococcus sp. YIM B11945 TaxID=3435410 RepID=UPI003D7CEFD0
MPKLIDSNKRKDWIAEAAWRVILKHGIEGASARNIAKEAGLSLGSLRYYFTTQEELMEYANRLIYERITKRADEIFKKDIDPREKIVQVLYELIPKGGELAQETEVRLAFKVHALHTKASYAGDEDGVYMAVKTVMSNLVLLNLLKKETNLALETERLYSFMDGLALDSLLRPEHLDETKIGELLIYHLNTICKEETRG